MTQRLIALFNNFEDAREAVEELVENGFSRDSISILAGDTDKRYSQYLREFNTDTSSHVTDHDVSGGEGAGFGAVIGTLIGLGTALIPGIGPVIAAGPLVAAVFAGIGAATGAVTGGLSASLIKFGVDESDANAYASTISKGGTLVVVDTDDSQRAEDVLEGHNPVDISEQWETETAGVPASQATTNGTTNYQSDRSGGSNRTVEAGQEQRIPIVEEELQVGKRQVEGGGVRVRKYVVETPVQENVTLREEHVKVDRQTVNRPASEADFNTFEEGTIEVTERHEEAVVSKNARVVEEVIVSKEMTQRNETVGDTIRRTEVEVENVGSGVNANMTYQNYADAFQSDYNTNYKNSGFTWDQYQPAYRYGYMLGSSDQYRNRGWEEIEPEARTNWETDNQGAWEDFKDAVRSAWYRVTGR